MKHSHIILIALMAALIMLSFGCAHDAIKQIKNDPDNMEIMMNHIVNDDTFRAKMVEHLIQKGDRQKFAEQIIQDKDMAKIILSKLVDTPDGKTEVAGRVGNRLELIKLALEKAYMLPEYREGIIEILLSNDDMVATMKNSTVLKEKICSE